MSDETLRRSYHKLAVDCFNETWDLLDKADRTPEEDLLMIHTSHASRYFWGEIGTPLEFQRGEWQVSRVYSVLGMGESALYHAESALNTCRTQGIKDFDLAFALEAVARAHSCLGNADQCGRFSKLAEEAAEEIEKKDDKDYFLSELASIS